MQTEWVRLSSWNHLITNKNKNWDVTKAGKVDPPYFIFQPTRIALPALCDTHWDWQAEPELVRRTTELRQTARACVCLYDETKCKHQRPFREAPDETEGVWPEGRLFAIDFTAVLKENINFHLSADITSAPSGWITLWSRGGEGEELQLSEKTKPRQSYRQSRHTSQTATPITSENPYTYYRGGMQPTSASLLGVIKWTDMPWLSDGLNSSLHTLQLFYL